MRRRVLGTKGESYSTVNGQALTPSDALSVQEIGNGVQFFYYISLSSYSKLSKSLAQLFADRDTARGP